MELFREFCLRAEYLDYNLVFILLSNRCQRIHQYRINILSSVWRACKTDVDFPVRIWPFFIYHICWRFVQQKAVFEQSAIFFKKHLGRRHEIVAVFHHPTNMPLHGLLRIIRTHGDGYVQQIVIQDVHDRFPCFMTDFSHPFIKQCITSYKNSNLAPLKVLLLYIHDALVTKFNHMALCQPFELQITA